MSIYRKALIFLISIVFLSTIAGVASAAEPMNITGMVNEEGQLVEDSGKIYDIADDEVGAQVLEHSGEKVTVEAMVAEGEGPNTIVIKSFKLAE